LRQAAAALWFAAALYFKHIAYIAGHGGVPLTGKVMADTKGPDARQ